MERDGEAQSRRSTKESLTVQSIEEPGRRQVVGRDFWRSYFKY